MKRSLMALAVLFGFAGSVKAASFEGLGTAEVKFQAPQQPAAPNVGNGVAHCSQGESFNTNPNLVLYQRDQWSAYTEKVPHKDAATGMPDFTQPNNTYLCVYGKMGLFFNGLFGDVAGDLAIADGMLVAKTIYLAPDDSGRVFLPTGQANGSAVMIGADQTPYLGKAGKALREIQSGDEFYIPVEGLKQKLEQAGGVLGVRRAAWVAKRRQFRAAKSDGAFEVYMHPSQDAAQAANIAAAHDAIKRFAPGSICVDQNGEVTPAVAEYVTKAIRHPKLEAWWAAETDKISRGLPSIFIDCNATKVGSAGAWEVVNPEWLPQEAVLMSREGKIEPSKI